MLISKTSPSCNFSSGLSSLKLVLQAQSSNKGLLLNSSNVVGLSQSLSSIFLSSLYQSLTKLQQSVIPQTHCRPNKGGLYPHGSKYAHCSVLGLTIYQGKLLSSQLILSA